MKASLAILAFLLSMASGSTVSESQETYTSSTTDAFYLDGLETRVTQLAQVLEMETHSCPN
jgi:hypothetical protein